MVEIERETRRDVGDAYQGDQHLLYLDTLHVQ